MKKAYRILPLIMLLAITKSYAQSYIWAPDSISLAQPNYAMDRYHDVLRYHDPIMYIAYPIIKPVVERSVGLQDGEGKNGFWVEGNFAYRFVIYQGKYFSYPALQRMRLTFDVGLTPRMARDNSSPLLPSNNKFGFGLDYLLSSLASLKKEDLTMVWTTIQLHHYSNGQSDSFFLNTPQKRNNYRDGDFSTNYLKVLLNISKVSQQKSIVSTAIGYQRDINLGGPLVMNRELDRYYGVNRLLFNFQWTRKPSIVSANYVNRASEKNDTVQVSRRKQFSIRSELEYILGDLSLFPGTNKYRIGWHNYLTYMPSVNNEVGFMLHTFLGRDYLNIRFDDIVFIGELGLFVKFNKR